MCMLVLEHRTRNMPRWASLLPSVKWENPSLLRWPRGLSLIFRQFFINIWGPGEEGSVSLALTIVICSFWELVLGRQRERFTWESGCSQPRKNPLSAQEAQSHREARASYRCGPQWATEDREQKSHVCSRGHRRLFLRANCQLPFPSVSLVLIS